MPISEHYSGRGKVVAKKMKQRYGKRWKNVFYATEQKRKNERKKRGSKR